MNGTRDSRWRRSSNKAFFMITIIIMMIIMISLSLFNRFAHSAGPGMVPQRVEAVGGGFDGLMQNDAMVRSHLGGMARKMVGP